MAKRDLSRGLGGASGQAASALRSRKSRLDAAIDDASRGTGKKPIRNAMKNKMPSRKK